MRARAPINLGTGFTQDVRRHETCAIHVMPERAPLSARTTACAPREPIAMRTLDNHRAIDDRRPAGDTPRDSLEHEITLRLASGVTLKLLYFSDREQRWIFAHRYVGERAPGAAPQIINDLRLTIMYEGGVIAPTFVLSMHVVVPSQLGQRYFVGVDISPGAKTYLEFSYKRSGDEYRLAEICKGARGRVRVADAPPAVVRPVEFPFPVPDRLVIEHGMLRVPFRSDAGTLEYLEFPERTLRT